jgi:hypothetical protein
VAGYVTFRVNSSQFDAALRQYAALTSKVPSEICNKKAYFIVRRAIWHTRKADIATMREQLGEHKAMELHRVKSGKRFSRDKKHIKSFFSQGDGNQGAPLLAMIIQARARRGGKGSPWKGVTREVGATRMLEAMRKVWNARVRSVAFIKSGWIAARDAFKQFSGGSRGLPPSEGPAVGGPKVIGQAKGGASVASKTGRAKAVFWNTASTKRDHKGALMHYGKPALQRAFDEETEDTMAEVERRLREQAKKAGIRTN